MSDEVKTAGQPSNTDHLSEDPPPAPHLLRHGSISTASSRSQTAAPLLPGFYTLPIHGNCPRCHHYHRAATVNVRVSRDFIQPSHVYCEKCKEKWLAFDSGNSTRISLLSTDTTEPDPVERNFRNELISMVRSVTSVAPPPAPGILPEQPAAGPSREVSVRYRNIDEGQEGDTISLRSTVSESATLSVGISARDTTSADPPSNRLVDTSQPPNTPMKVHQPRKAIVKDHFRSLKHLWERYLHARKGKKIPDRGRAKLPIPQIDPIDNDLITSQNNRAGDSRNSSRDVAITDSDMNKSNQFNPVDSGESSMKAMLQDMSEEQRVAWIREQFSDYKCRCSSQCLCRRARDSVSIPRSSNTSSGITTWAPSPFVSTQEPPGFLSHDMVMIGSHFHGFQAGDLHYNPSILHNRSHFSGFQAGDLHSSPRILHSGSQTQLPEETTRTQLLLESSRPRVSRQGPHPPPRKKSSQTRISQDSIPTQLSGESSPTWIPQENNQVRLLQEISRPQLSQHSYQTHSSGEITPTRLPQELSQTRLLQNSSQTQFPDGGSQTQFSQESNQTQLSPEGIQSLYEHLEPNMSQNAGRQLANMLWECSDLHALYVEVLMKMDKDTFSRNHDHLLKSFLEELRSEITNEKQLRTVRLLQHRGYRKQITDWIYNNFNSDLGMDTLKAREDSVDQEINRSLHSRPKGDELNTVEESEDKSEDEKDESESEEDFIGSDELSSTVRSFTQGPPFEQLRINLICLVHPEKAIGEAVKFHNFKLLRTLLTQQFDRVAVHEYAWIKELANAGYTRDDITNLLAEESVDSPWIYFDIWTTVKSLASCNVEFHVAGCVHNISENAHLHKDANLKSYLDFEEDDINEKIQELVGLAGIRPTSRDQTQWNGSVTFMERNSAAELTYAPDSGDMNPAQIIIERAILCLQHFSHAFNSSQSAGFCCSTFTVLVHRNTPLFIPMDEPDPVELRHIDIGLIINLATSLEELVLGAVFSRPSVRRVQRLALAVLNLLGHHHFPVEEYMTLEETLHVIALSAQFVSLGFLSYNQAHIGHIQPYFLDTALTKITLLGSYKAESDALRIVVEPAKLTCIGEMLQASVMTFSVHRPGTKPAFDAYDRSYHLSTTAEDLLETWGPGNFVVPAGQTGPPLGIRLCGGTIYCTNEADSSFHWSKNAAVDGARPISLSPQTIMKIGALVTVNNSCQLSEQDCWRRSYSAFEYLGVQDDYWKYDENQTGGQIGQYTLLQHNRTRHKIPGKTLKQIILEDDPRVIIEVLNCLWGLQVSFCTGVARRVPVRLLMADLLPVFATTFSSEHYTWDKLDTQYKILDAFNTEDVQNLFNTLPPDIATCLLNLMRKILLTLEPTGIGPKGEHLMVAWPYNKPPFNCFHISCHDKLSSWARVLADSRDCATFAYITTCCFVARNINCRGPSPSWRNVSPLLETAILRHNENPSELLGPLEHKKTYFFKKVDDILQVTVERWGTDTGAGEVSLYVQSSSIPSKFRQRVQRMAVVRKESLRIRERRERDDPGAEQVTILARSSIHTPENIKVVSPRKALVRQPLVRTVQSENHRQAICSITTTSENGAPIAT